MEKMATVVAVDDDFVELRLRCVFCDGLARLHGR